MVVRIKQEHCKVSEQASQRSSSRHSKGEGGTSEHMRGQLQGKDIGGRGDRRKKGTQLKEAVGGNWE